MKNHKKKYKPNPAYSLINIRQDLIQNIPLELISKANFVN